MTPLDALLLINDINLHGARTLSATNDAELEAYLDPDGNGSLEPRDVLMTIGVINGALDAPAASEVGGENASESSDGTSSIAGLAGSAVLAGTDAAEQSWGREVSFVNPWDIAAANRWLRPTLGEATQVVPESVDQIWSKWARGRYQLESADLTDLALESLYGDFA